MLDYFYIYFFVFPVFIFPRKLVSVSHPLCESVVYSLISQMELIFATTKAMLFFYHHNLYTHLKN